MKNWWARNRKLILRVVAIAGAAIAIIVIAALIAVQTPWFANFVRGKIVAAVEESTGGRVELQSFEFNPWGITARIRNFVLHGTEPAGSAPLARVALLEVRLKLLSGLKKAVDIRYLGIEQPQVNLIVFPDGNTNVPEPKVKKKSAPSSESPLETVVNLAVGEFRITDGLVQFAQRKSALAARGENLRLQLDYNTLSPSYQGSLAIDPLLVTSGANPTLPVHILLPLLIEKNGLQLKGGRITTAASQILLDSSLENLNAPRIAAKLNANISIPEMAGSFALPLDTKSPRSPRTLTAELAANVENGKVIAVRTANVGLGQTTVQASGTLNPETGSELGFRSNFDLPELLSLLKVAGIAATGALHANGKASLDRNNDYKVDGELDSAGISVRSGDTRIQQATLASPFHADPYLISLDHFKLNALGGSLDAKIFLQKLQQLSVEARLGGFNVAGLTTALTGKRLGYDGNLNGTVNARGDLSAKGTRGYQAQANLNIAPGSRGVPLSGRIVAAYNGARDSVDLAPSFIGMPHSRLDLNGALNREIDLHLVSRNLNDFLPAANFGAAKPQASLPVTLRNGVLDLQAKVKGKLAAPQIQSQLALDRFAVEGRDFDRLGLDANASSSGAAVSNGVLRRGPLDTRFDASIGLRKWSPLPQSPLAANVVVRNGDVADLLSLAGESDIPATGKLTSDIHIHGAYGNPLGDINLNVRDATAYNQPIDHLTAAAALSDGLASLNNLEIASAGAKLNANGTFRHPHESFTTGHADFHVRTQDVKLEKIQPLQDQAAGTGGDINLVADLGADVVPHGNDTVVNISNVFTDLKASGLRVQNQDAGNLSLTAQTQGRDVVYVLNSNFAGSDVKANGRTSLANNYRTVADASIRNLSVEKVTAILGQGDLPARGTFNATAHLAGDAKAPDANLEFALNRANFYGEQIDSFGGRVHYTNTLVDLPSLSLEMPAGRVDVHGSFAHPAGDFNSGAVDLKLDSSDIRVSKIHHAVDAKPGLDGVVRLAADISGRLRKGSNGKPLMDFARLNALARADALRVNNSALGDFDFEAKSSGSNVDYKLDSTIAKSEIHGAGTTTFTGDFPTRANVSFRNIRYENLAPFISEDPEPPAFATLVEGQASINGPVLQSDNLVARLQLDRLEVNTKPRRSPTGAPPTRQVAFHNEGPIVVALDHSNVNVQHFDIEGPKTSLKASGGMNLKNARSPLGLTLDANSDLGVLQDLDRSFYSSGNLNLHTVIRGTMAQPLLNGQVELKNANVNYADSPNGLSNANGIILLNGTSASIQNLTGESGGGKITLAGFAGYTSRNVDFNVRATASRVRVRSSGLSITSDADVSLVGNLRRSLASGQITIHKIAYGSSSDAGSFLSTASTPPTAPSNPSPLLTGMRLDVRIVTAPDLRVITTYADRMSIEANLSVRGTAATPGIIGQLSVTDGQLVFFGNKYTVNTGTVNFYNPTAIQPILNFSLETIAQNVDVVLSLRGPVNNLALTYRSDPPLTFQQIVQLLATNTTPADPTIAARQPAPSQQSLTQMGSSALLGQAVANPLASRVQRVFGLSQFKIDPSVAGSNGQPTAKVTLQQKIASNITFTYITDVTQTNSQIIRVEWALTPRLSAFALRDFNGNISVQAAYKFKVQ